MPDGFLARVNYLTFDIFGTVMDLTGSLSGPAGEFLAAHGSELTGPAFYAEWRARQRIEQYQDNLLMLGHSGYLETCRRAFVYCLKNHNVSYTSRRGPGVHEGVPGASSLTMTPSRGCSRWQHVTSWLRYPMGSSGTWRSCWATTSRLRSMPSFPWTRLAHSSRPPGSTAKQSSGWAASPARS